MTPEQELVVELSLMKLREAIRMQNAVVGTAAKIAANEHIPLERDAIRLIFEDCEKVGQELEFALTIIMEACFRKAVPPHIKKKLDAARVAASNTANKEDKSEEKANTAESNVVPLFPKKE